MIDWFDDAAFEDYPTFGEEEEEWSEEPVDDQDDPWGYWNDPFEAVYDAGAELLGGVKDTVDNAVRNVTDVPEEVANQLTEPANAYVDRMPAEPARYGLFNLDAGAVLTAAAVALGALFVADQLFARGTGTAALVARATGSR